MTDTIVRSALDYYARINAALFPIPYGSKAPIGIISSFAHDYSRDPVQWDKWFAEHKCNFGLVAGPSRLIIVDVDVAEVGRETAWNYWAEWCTSRDLPVFAPYCESARGGWHIAFSLPGDLDLSTLRQCPLVGAIAGVSKKAIIDLRVGNGFVVAAGSFYDGTAKGEASGTYSLMSPDDSPHAAPSQLIAACARAVPKTNGVALAGSRDRNDVAALLVWMNEHDLFSDYDSWLNAGLSLKIEYGDDGLALWELTHDNTVSSDVIESKWNSFAGDPKPGMTTLNSLLAKAHSAGWTGTVRKSASSMFDGVARIAAAAGASLSSGMPPSPGGGVPMMAGQAELARLAAPILSEFLSATGDSPSRPAALDYPTLPAAMSEHGLYQPMSDSLTRIFAMAEPPNKFKAARTVDALAILNVMHADIFDSACRRLRAMGHTLPDRRIKLAAANLSEKVERITVTHDKWEYDSKGEIQADNSDNVQVLLGILGLSIRWNAWLERMEIHGGIDADLRWPVWTYVDDAIVAKLRTRANRTKTRFRPGKDFLWESLLALAHQNAVDPALDRLAELESLWDRTPRLAVWLSAVCGVPCDPYHQSVAKNIIGGMVRRARHPGCKHDTMAVFFGFQGSGKSTMAALLATVPEWFSDTVLLGDAAKELVLSLAGKLVVEIGEMGMRGSANPNHVKAMLSRQVDAGRTAYARSVSERPRRNIFIGTTNDDEPLVDPTGNRRFLPVKVEREINLEWLRANIEQIVGEAAALESQGADFAIPRDVWAIATEHQEAARSASDMETLLADWFEPTTHSGDVSFILAPDLIHLADMAGWRNGGATATRGAIMKRLGFRSEKIMFHGKRTTIWARGHEGVRPIEIPRVGVRYMIGQTQDGRPQVTIRKETAPNAVMPPVPVPR